MRLLKKDTTICWDEQAQESFDALKWALASTSGIIPLDYSRDFLLYVAASMEMIGMVLVQEDEELQEHVIYYLSWNLIVIVDFTTHGESQFYGLPCTYADSLDPMDHFCSFDVS